MQHGAAAHGAGLQGDVERAVLQPVVAQLLCCSAQSDDFSMRRRVVALHRSVAPGGNYLALAHHHGAHGHFAVLRRRTRLGQRQAHPVRIGSVIHML